MQIKPVSEASKVRYQLAPVQRFRRACGGVSIE